MPAGKIIRQQRQLQQQPQQKEEKEEEVLVLGRLRLAGDRMTVQKLNRMLSPRERGIERFWKRSRFIRRPDHHPE